MECISKKTSQKINNKRSKGSKEGGKEGRNEGRREGGTDLGKGEGPLVSWSCVPMVTGLLVSSPGPLVLCFFGFWFFHCVAKDQRPGHKGRQRRPASNQRSEQT